MKICGTVRLPPDFSIISAIKLGAVVMSILVISVTPLRASKASARVQYGQVGVLYMVISGMVVFLLVVSKNLDCHNVTVDEILGFYQAAMGGMMGEI